MASLQMFVFFAFMAVLPLYSSGETCLSPNPSYEVYTTSEATMSSETVFIVEFSVVCKNKLQNLNLYAEFDGKVLPVTQVIAHDKYQISYNDKHKDLPSGTYSMRIMDEETYADLRKAQRSGEDASSIKSLFTITIEHKAASQGPVVQSEVVATGVALLVWYIAYSTRSKLQS